MDATSPRWQQVTPSQHAWEEDALAVLRALLPDQDPYRAWTNFEFTDGGRIHEADALVVTPKGVFLVEIKSWTGAVNGNQGTWVQRRRDGSLLSVDNPARLNTAKVRSLASLIRAHWPGGPTAPRPPFITSLVWFSNPTLRVSLPRELWPQVAVTRDAPTDGDAAQHRAPERIRSIEQAILRIGDAEAKDPNFRRVSPEQSTTFAEVMGRIGFKESTRTRMAGSYELQLPAFAERGATQDFMARHKVHGLAARVRVYSNVVGASTEEARALKDAASREYLATRNLSIDGVIRAIDMDLTDFGPAVIFEQPPGAVRLDRFMAEHGDSLDLDARLDIVEQLVATVRAMHKRRVTHRMLTPESVWLRPLHADGSRAQRFEPLISDFSLAAREHQAESRVATCTRIGSLPAAQTGAVDIVLGDPAMETYLAPETSTDSNADGVALDVFSVGALTYLLCTGRAPAFDRSQMRAALGSTGLSLSAVLPEVDPQLESLVRRCTTPIVSERTGDMAAVADELALVRAGLDGDAPSGPVDPLTAAEGDVLEDRFEVRRRLGKGSTAVGLWCHDRTHDRDVVLKVASSGDSDLRLDAEADALASLRQQNVVELYESLTITGRRVLVLSFAGDRSLAGYLRAEGSVSTEFLLRWGEDLLEAVRYLEKVGVAHRDVKPDNLGIVEMGPHKKSHLVLFDFSLAGASSDDISAGTPPYLDPFLSDDGRGRYDLAAERYAAAVTIHEMATGETPTWGDGQTAPEYLPADVQPELLVDAIDPEVRAPVVAFLTRALQRRPQDRFDTADEMARAWLDAFAGWDASDSDVDTSTTTTDDGASAAGAALAANLSLDDPIASLPTTQKVRSALRKLGADTVRGVAGVEPVAVNKTRGVSVKTRKEVLRLRAAVLERFADELAAGGAATVATATVDTATQDTATQGTATQPALPTDGATNGADTVATGSTTGGSTAAAGSHAVPVPDLDQLGLRLVPPRGKRGPAGTVAATTRLLLGLDPITTDDAADDTGAVDDWPTMSAVARRTGVTTGAVSNTHQKARTHWGSSPELTAVATDLVGLLADLGGVAGVTELVDPLIDARGSGHEPADARRLASAVIRAALDAASPTAEWFTTRRSGRRTIVAVNGPGIAATASTTPTATDPSSAADDTTAGRALLDPAAVHLLGAINPAPLLDLAVALGRAADGLVADGELVPAGVALPALRARRGNGPAGAGADLSDARLARLAAAASDRAATNAASDLMPVAATAADALRWSRAALVGAARLTLADITGRVAARVPHVQLPGRPALDQLLVEVGFPLEWSESDQAYRSTAVAPGGIGPFTRVVSRDSTVFSVGGSPVAPAVSDPTVAEAIAVDERLLRSLRDGGFLALRAPTNELVAVQRQLARFQTTSPGVTPVDLESRFLQHLRAAADRNEVPWSSVEAADDPSDAHWMNLGILAGQAIDATIDEVAQMERVLAWFPGVLVRHADTDATAPLDRLRDAVGTGGSSLRTLWLVVLGGTASALPMVDDTPVPVLSSSQWLDLPPAWLRNTHRAGGAAA